MFPRTLIGATAVALAACGSGVSPLDGSLADSVDMSYTRSTLQMEQTVLALRFERARGSTFDTVLKVGITLDSATPPNHPVQYDLAEMVNGAQRGVATRNVLDDPNTTLPLILRGTFSLDQAMAGAMQVSGNITMTFDQGDTFGAGMAIFGPFDAAVEK
jgi:hypothetical protein